MNKHLMNKLFKLGAKIIIRYATSVFDALENATTIKNTFSRLRTQSTISYDDFHDACVKARKDIPENHLFHEFITIMEQTLLYMSTGDKLDFEIGIENINKFISEKEEVREFQHIMTPGLEETRETIQAKWGRAPKSPII